MSGASAAFSVSFTSLPSSAPPYNIVDECLEAVNTIGDPSNATAAPGMWYIQNVSVWLTVTATSMGSFPQLCVQHPPPPPPPVSSTTLWAGHAVWETYMEYIQGSPGTFGTPGDVIYANWTNWATGCTVESGQSVYSTSYVTHAVALAAQDCIGFVGYTIDSSGVQTDTYNRNCWQCGSDPLTSTGESCTDRTFSSCSGFLVGNSSHELQAISSYPSISSASVPYDLQGVCTARHTTLGDPSSTSVPWYVYHASSMLNVQRTDHGSYPAYCGVAPAVASASSDGLALNDLGHIIHWTTFAGVRLSQSAHTLHLAVSVVLSPVCSRTDPCARCAVCRPRGGRRGDVHDAGRR